LLRDAQVKGGPQIQAPVTLRFPAKALRFPAKFRPTPPRLVLKARKAFHELTVRGVNTTLPKTETASGDPPKAASDVATEKT
jgi:hypothetical protein